MKQYFLVSSICISLIPKVAKHLFICLLTMHVFSFAKELHFPYLFSYLFVRVLCIGYVLQVSSLPSLHLFVLFIYSFLFYLSIASFEK